MPLDLDFIRSQYPVFSNPETARWAMFENAGGSYVPRQVTDRLHDFFQFTKVQPYGPFEASVAAGQTMEAGYKAMADLLNCDPNELTLGPSTTMNCYVLAQAIRPASITAILTAGIRFLSISSASVRRASAPLRRTTGIR